jgi:hypothetical protein
MPNPSLDSEIQSRIQSFLDELSQLVKRQALEAVHLALGGSAAPARRGPGRPRKVSMRPGRKPRMIAKRGGKRVRRSPEDLAKLQATVLAAVKAKQGQRLEEIGKALKTDTSGLKRPVALLVASKKLKTTGKKRGTKYFVR